VENAIIITDKTRNAMFLSYTLYTKIQSGYSLIEMVTAINDLKEQTPEVI
jgi:hypothetical protein